MYSVFVPSPIVVEYVVQANPVSVPAANLVPSNFNTWFVVAPVVSISIPSTNNVETFACVVSIVEGRDNV